MNANIIKISRNHFTVGQMLLNWMSSSSQPLYNVSDQDISPLIQQYCTNLLVAGVIKQIADKYAPIQETFRVSLNAYAMLCMLCCCVMLCLSFYNIIVTICIAAEKSCYYVPLNLMEFTCSFAKSFCREYKQTFSLM